MWEEVLEWPSGFAMEIDSSPVPILLPLLPAVLSSIYYLLKDRSILRNGLQNHNYK